MNSPYDIICVGAGPTGLACAMEAKRAGMRPLVIDKGCLCNSLYHYPANLRFFTTAERMEIGDLPMAIAGDKPSRVETLKYYRRAVEHYELDVRLYERVLRVAGHDGAFEIVAQSGEGGEKIYRGGKIVLATGYYDRPNLLNIPGETLPHVSHYFTDPHPYWRQEVVVVGAKNSAAEAALDLFRGGARVTLVHRGPSLGASLKYWVRPDIENRIRAGEVKALFNTAATRIEPGKVWVKDGRAESPLMAQQVFAMTGYHPDFTFLEAQGVELDPVTKKPACDPVTHESNVPGLFIAGVLIGGKQTGEIFIENGRFHGKEIIARISGNNEPLGPPPVNPPGE